MKHDKNKIRWHLMPWNQLSEVAKVIEHGAKKYNPDDWKTNEDGSNRYFSAAMRHLMAWRAGEYKDKESGLSHLSHAVCSLLFVMWFERGE